MSLKLRSKGCSEGTPTVAGETVGQWPGNHSVPSVSAAELLVLIYGSSTVNQECQSMGELVGQVTNRLPHPLWSVNPPF